MKYEIKFTEEMWNRLIIEAESEKQARDKFFSGEWDDEEASNIGGEIHPDIELKPLSKEEVSA